MKKLIKNFKIFLLAGSVLAVGWAAGSKALAQTQMNSSIFKTLKSPSIEKVRADVPGGRYQGYQRGYRSSERWEGSRRPYYHRDWDRYRHHHHYYGWRWYYYPSWWYSWPGYYYYYYPWNPWWYW